MQSNHRNEFEKETKNRDYETYKSVPEILKKREGEASNQVGLCGDTFEISLERALPNRTRPRTVSTGNSPLLLTVVVRNGVCLCR